MKKIFFFILVLCSTAIHAQTNIISTIAGNGTWTYSGDGVSATDAGMCPFGVAVDFAGNVFIADMCNNRVRKVSTSGTISTIAGNGTAGFGGDGGPATNAMLISPYGIAVDTFGNIFIADGGNSRIRKINPSGIISTIAGNGTAGTSGNGGPATSASLYYPYGIAVDNVGNVYMADLMAIRKINTFGIISIFAGIDSMGFGVGGFSGDGGPATAARLNNPIAVTADNAGNIYIADLVNSRIRKVNTSGIITTIAGNGATSYSGDGGPATTGSFYYPVGVVTDPAGNVYVADNFNYRVRMINTSGNLSTFAGNGSGGFSGDGGAATSASLGPLAVASDRYGNIYIADTANARIRKVAGSTTSIGQFNSVSGAQPQIYPNPANTQLTIEVDIANYQSVYIKNVIGQEMLHSNILSYKTQIPLTQLPTGIYYITFEGVKGRVEKMFEKI